MAVRPVFVPVSFPPFYQEREIEFQWYPGQAVAQARRSIESLHSRGAALGISPILEISSRSTDELGVALSAFNLRITRPDGGAMSVECAYQGSKVFEAGGPFADLYEVSSQAAKTDARLTQSGNLLRFDYLGTEFALEPETDFYHFLYLQALAQHPGLSGQLREYKGFTDIVYNPKRGVNCQARAAAQFVGLSSCGKLEEMIKRLGESVAGA